MSLTIGRLARALLLTTGIAIAIALPGLVGTPLMPSPGDPGARIAMAAPASDNDGNDDPTNDNSDERNIEGQILDGLSEGQTLVLHPPDTLKDGTRIRERVQ